MVREYSYSKRWAERQTQKKKVKTSQYDTPPPTLYSLKPQTKGNIGKMPESNSRFLYLKRINDHLEDSSKEMNEIRKSIKDPDKTAKQINS